MRTAASVGTSVQEAIKERLRQQGEGYSFFASEFHDLAPAAIVQRAIRQLVKEGFLLRAAKGIYHYPKHHPMLGVLRPSVESIAQMVAQRYNCRIVPSEGYALNALRLSEQVPMNTRYLTDGRSRTFMVGKVKVVFTGTKSTLFDLKGKITQLVAIACRHLDDRSLTPSIRGRIFTALSHESIAVVEADSYVAPTEVREIFTSYLDHYGKRLDSAA